MGFRSNQSEAAQGNVIKPEGKYECVIAKIERRTTKNGANGINFSLVVRNDIESQQYKNAYIFHTIWRKKEPNDLDKQVEGFNYAQLMAMGKAAKLPDGKDYENLDEYLKDLNGKCLLVTLKHQEYNGSEQERVNFMEETKHPECKHKFKNTDQGQTNYIRPDENANSAIGSLADFEQVVSSDGVPF